MIQQKDDIFTPALTSKYQYAMEKLSENDTEYVLEPVSSKVPEERFYDNC